MNGGGDFQRGKRSTRGEHLSQKCEDFTRNDDFNVSSIIKRFLTCIITIIVGSRRFWVFFADDDEGTTRRKRRKTFLRDVLPFRLSLFLSLFVRAWTSPSFSSKLVFISCTLCTSGRDSGPNRPLAPNRTFACTSSPLASPRGVTSTPPSTPPRF